MTKTCQRLKLLLGIALLLGLLVNCAFSSAPETGPTNRREQLLATMIEEYLQLTDYELVQSKALVQSVLADAEVRLLQSDLMEAERRIMENFVRQVNDKEQEEPPARNNLANRLFYLIAKSLIYQEFEAILRRHDTTNPRRKFMPENQIMERALKRHGLESLQRRLSRKQIQFMNDFVKEVDTYLAHLTPEQRGRDEVEAEKMVEWSAKMKTENDVALRMENFKEFMRFFVKF
uniref:tRNA (Guanine-N(1)-)-methyltransferase n=1 Tax=Zeugodacus cucurbitae TaxID=28588 RepID=A0A0A1X5R6_ZEUCU